MSLDSYFSRYILVVFVFLSGISCTNYSTTASVQAPPTLISITSNGSSNFTIKVRAQNPEFIFQGYRLYTGISEKEVQNPTDLNLGTDCVLASSTIVQPVEYTFEIDPSTKDNATGVSCRFFATLTPGTYIAMRTLGLAVNLQNSSSSFKVSPSSNTLIVP
ncbi:hypothetical protein NUH30_03720 [Leptospira sp. 85282-16]|nr:MULTISPECIES: hypothetical protein [Leptospira]MCT8332771.1 hypothetical protein [Leptospira sp. 85282-16]